MKSFWEELTGKEEVVAGGLMSGTSMDGVDAALVRMAAGASSPALEVVAFQTVPYPDELKTSLKGVAFGEQCSAEDIATLNTSVAVAFANSFYTVCRQAGVESNRVDFIGSHGQTVAHVPPASDGMNLIAGTLQLGPPGMIAALTGVMTVGDFRVADVALGGQGAPLAPFVDYLLRRSDTRDRVILNIGGIANLTYLPQGGGPDEVVAFDTGPGNMILDELVRVQFPNVKSYEEITALIERGKASDTLVDAFLEFSYFSQKPPKSAGHREFGAAFAWELLSKAEAAGLRSEDTLASALALTTRSIRAAVKDIIEPLGGVDEVFVTGGGSHNKVIMAELADLLAPAEVMEIDQLGIPADAKEAVDFAVLAREAIFGRPNVLHRTTGASKAQVLGTIALGSRS